MQFQVGTTPIVVLGCPVDSGGYSMDDNSYNYGGNPSWADFIFYRNGQPYTVPESIAETPPVYIPPGSEGFPVPGTIGTDTMGNVLWCMSTDDTAVAGTFQVAVNEPNNGYLMVPCNFDIVPESVTVQVNAETGWGGSALPTSFAASNIPATVQINAETGWGGSALPTSFAASNIPATVQVNAETGWGGSALPTSFAASNIPSTVQVNAETGWGGSALPASFAASNIPATVQINAETGWGGSALPTSFAASNIPATVQIDSETGWGGSALPTSFVVSNMVTLPNDYLSTAEQNQLAAISKAVGATSALNTTVAAGTVGGLPLLDADGKIPAVLAAGSIVTDTLGTCVPPAAFFTNMPRSTGDGTVSVDQDYGGTGCLAYTTAAGDGVQDGTVLAFLQEDWDAGRRDRDAIRGSTLTTADGAWRSPLRLLPATYVFQFFKLGVYNPTTITVVVS